MTDRSTPVQLGAKLFLPFVIGDLVLLGAAFLIWQQAQRPMSAYEVGAFAGCVALGAWLSVWPFRLRHQAELKLAETASLTDTLAQIGQVEDAAARIDAATGRWQTVQDYAGQTMTAAREIADRIAAEQRDFRAFMQKAEDTERNHLRLEVNKLRRAEGDWLQVLVRILDHVYALHLAGVRSGQPHLIEQFTQFQNACRDAARRVGLVPLTAAADTPFDSEVHQLPDPNAVPPAGAKVAETLATGHAFQGQLLRRAVVSLKPTDVPRPSASTVESFSTHTPATEPSTGEPPSPRSPAPEPNVAEPAAESGTEAAAVGDASSPASDTLAESAPIEPGSPPPEAEAGAVSPPADSAGEASPGEAASRADLPASPANRRTAQPELLL